MINESPTDKLIRELREENQRLMDMLKSGGLGASVATAAFGDPSASNQGDSISIELRILLVGFIVSVCECLRLL